VKSIRLLFSGLFALVILFSVGMVASISLMVQLREADESAEILIGLIGGRVEDLIDLEFRELTSLERIYARQFETERTGFTGNVHDEAFVREMIASVRTQSLMTKAMTLSFVDANGRCLALDRRRTATPVVKLCDLSKNGSIRWYGFETFGSAREPLMQSVMASDIREDPAFLGALKRREAVISGLHLSHWRSDAQVVSVYEPVYDRKEKYRLMVMADMDVRTIAINLQGLQVPTGTSLFLFDGGGRLLASSLRQTDEETGVSDPAVFPVLSKNQAPSIQAANLALAGQKGGYVVNEEKTLRIKQGDELYYVYVSPVVRGSGQDWSFAIVIPQSALINHILYGIRIAAWVTGGLVIFAILMGIYLAGWITRPIQTLGKAAQALELNQLDDPVMPMSALTEDSKRPNEFGRLATLFLRMIAEVRARHRLLEIQLEQLRVDVNDKETEAEVQAIADTEFFQGLRATALKLRGVHRHDVEV
jgi:HAMP domain-containing protein